MRRKQERANDTLALRSAYSRLRHWTQRLAAANASNNDELAQQASQFVTEYQDFIRELEQQTAVQAIADATSSLASAPAVVSTSALEDSASLEPGTSHAPAPKEKPPEGS